MVGRVGQQNPDPAHCCTPERQQRRPVPIDTKSDFASIPPTHTLGGPAVNPQRPAKVGFCCPPPPGSGRAGWAAAPPIVSKKSEPDDPWSTTNIGRSDPRPTAPAVPDAAPETAQQHCREQRTNSGTCWAHRAPVHRSCPASAARTRRTRRRRPPARARAASAIQLAARRPAVGRPGGFCLV